MTTQGERYLKPEELAEFLGVTRGYVVRAAKKGEIPAIRFGRVLRFRLSEVQKTLEGSEAGL